MRAAQTNLFPAVASDAHPVALRALAAGAVLSASVSGGKDSQAMLARLMDLRRAHGWAGPVEAIHADLGRAEWPQTPAHVEATVARERVPLVVVQRDKGDLVQRIEERLNTVSTLDPTRPAKPFWPSAAQRYCTSDLKRGPIRKHVRRHGPHALVVSAQGMRAAESHNRAKTPVLSLERGITGKAYLDAHAEGATLADLLDWHLTDPAGRLVLRWLPIHDWDDHEVWTQFGTDADDLDRRRALHASGAEADALDGWLAHPAYVLGNTRLSCSLCVLASRADLLNGIKHNRPLAEHYAALEERTGYTFTEAVSIADLITEADRLEATL